MEFRAGDLIKYRNHYTFGTIKEVLEDDYLVIITYSDLGECIDRTLNVELVARREDRKDDYQNNFIIFGGKQL